MITTSLYVISILVCDLRLKVGKKGAVLGEKIEEMFTENFQPEPCVMNCDFQLYLHKISLVWLERYFIYQSSS